GIDFLNLVNLVVVMTMDGRDESAQSTARPLATSALTISLGGVELTRMKLLSPLALCSKLLGKSVIESLLIIVRADHDSSLAAMSKLNLELSLLDQQSSPTTTTIPSTIHPLTPISTVPDDDQLK